MVKDKILKLQNECCTDGSCKISQFDMINDILADVVCGKKIVIESKKITNNVRYISIVGKDISFIYPNALTVISKFASNVEIYSQLNGTIHINFMFYGLKF